jgi:hypothetical protein
MWELGEKRRPARRGATRNVLERATRQPGGIIRWSEAESWYQEVAPQRTHWAGWKMNLSRLLKRYFVRVGGVRGHYMLRSFGEPLEADDAV